MDGSGEGLLPPTEVLARIREHVRSGQHALTLHAYLEADKEGISLTDIEHAVVHGAVLEHYGDRCRYLVGARAGDGYPIHVVIEYANPEQTVVVTAYVADKTSWRDPEARRRRG